MLKLYKNSYNKLPSDLYVPINSEAINTLKILEKDLNIKFLTHLNSLQFKGNFMEKCTFEVLNQKNSYSITFIGLGKSKTLDEEKVFKVFSFITYSRIKSKKKIKESSIIMPDCLSYELLSLSIQGLYNGFYSFDKYKSKKDNLSLYKLGLTSKSVTSSKLSSLILNAKDVFTGVNLTRQLINETPQTITPSALASYAKKIAKGSTINCTVFGKKEILKKKMLGIWDVGKGSVNEPKFIHLSYKSKNTKKNIKKIALIGKGVTYDTGGLSLKPADYMLTMKMDMGGAGCVLGVFQALSRLKPKNIEVHGLIPAVENMPGPNAYKPDDVVIGLSGKTIEVINTDAEGRVVLSDAIEFANRLKVDEMVDLATLTGACMVALGNFTAGLFSNNDKLKDKLIKASKLSGEKMWHLPLDEELRPSIDSLIADVKNSASTRYGGATTAAMFLEFFVDKNIPWSHIDIAGPAYIDKDRGWCAPGSTGFAVRSLINYLNLS
jgi:leucyl aminopeptidase